MKFKPDYKSQFRILKGGKISLVVSALLGSVTLSFAAPTGGVITSGSATISQNTNTTNIQQSTQKATINWQGFSINSNETVNFNQPNVNAITLNRVVGNERSVIDGALNANGQVWILNSNGILFNQNAKINTAGIIATTKNISDADFNAGNYKFSGESTASVINMGTIETSDSGYVALLANTVQNDGTIKAYKGTVHLTGANEATINLNGNSIVNLTVNKGVLDALVENKGAIIADGGKIYLTTNAVDELLKGVVNNTGVIEAKSLEDMNSEVILFAHGGTANISGEIKVDGGFVETSGKELSVADGTVIKAKKWLLDPTNVIVDELANGGTITAATIESQLNAEGVSEIEIQADGGDITINQAINIYTEDGSTDEGIQYTVGGLTLIAGNDININEVITVGPEGYLALNHGWNGTEWDGSNEAIVYGNGGRITLGMNAEKTDFVGKIAFASNVNTPGSENSAIYINEVEQTIIRDATQLQNMNVDKTGNYVLANDINLNGVTWTPIGSVASGNRNYSQDFKGSFNGLGHTISNLTLNGEFKYTDGSGGQAAGLFGNIAGNANIAGVRLLTAQVTNTANLANNYNNWTAQTAALVGAARAEQDNNYDIIGSPTIHNNIVTESEIMATGDGSNVGGIVGEANHATISGNSVANQTAIVSQNKRRVGGIVGSAEASTIVDSYIAGAQIVSGYGEVGGIAGYISDGTIVDNATVKESIIIAQSETEGTYGAGGIVGTSYYDSENRSEIKNSSVDSSMIIAMQDVGGIIGEMEETKITNSFYNLSTTRIGDDVADYENTPYDVITYGAINAPEYNTWLTENKASLSASSLLGAADANGYYSIDDMTDFVKMMALAYDPANKFKLSADLDLQNSGFYLPVLRGELDGNNHTISGLTVSQSYNSHIGLVGRLEGGTIKNLTLSSPNLNGYSYVGGVVGHATQSDDGTKSPTISNVTVNNFTYSYTKEFFFPSEVYDTNYDTYIDNIGAIGGDVENATLSNLNASGSITINVAANNGHDDGTVGVSDIGGLIGDMYDSSLDTATSSVTIDIDALAKAYNSDDEYADINEVEVEQIGGLIGKGNSNSLIKNVTATGAIDIKSTVEAGTPEEGTYVIEGSADIYDVGGLFGDMGESYIKNASATNTITVESNEVVNVGGLVGYTDDSLYDTATTSGALTIKDGAEYVEKIGGAFGEAYGSILKDVDSTRNVTLEGSPSDGAENIGGLAGYAEETNIMSSSYTGTIDVNEVEEEISNIGGLVGTNYGNSGDKSFVSFETTIDAGLSTEAKQAQRDVLLAAYNLREDVIALKALGYTVVDDSWGNEGQQYYVNFSIKTPDNTEWGVIKDSTASVNIKAQNAQNVGGLVGHMSAEDGGQITNSSVTALNGTSKVDGYSNVGGLVGKNSYGNIVDSDAAINVKANSTSEANIGGLVGYIEGDERSDNIYVNYSDYADDYTWSYATEQEALDALESVKAQYIADRLEENPGFEEDYVQAQVVNYNFIPNTILIDLELVKYIPIGAISNSYATGTVTSAGSNAGGLVGNISEATITGSHATGAVTGAIKHVGGLVGYSTSSTIEDSYATGAVSGTGLSSNWDGRVGGLVGTNKESTISNSYASGDVTSAGRFVGGLVGYNDATDSDALITDSYATGDVSGVTLVGGLVGISFGDSADGKIINSYATGDVTGTEDYIGGLVGANENYGEGSAIIENSYATGAVSGAGSVGGLVGENAFFGSEGDTGVSKVSNSYATGTVNGETNVGGLVGEGAGSIIETSYATGKVTGISEVGGLVGKDVSSTISNVYSSGEVEASGNNVGSLMGQADGSSITNSYASGKITQTGEEQINVKGLIGNVDAQVLNSFYDKTVNADMADESTRGKTTTELKTLATYTSEIEPTWDMSGENGHYPILGFQTEDAETTWVMAEGEMPVNPTPEPTPTPSTPTVSTPTTSTPVATTPTPTTTTVKPAPVAPVVMENQQVNKVIDTIVNQQQVKVELPKILVTQPTIMTPVFAPKSTFVLPPAAPSSQGVTMLSSISQTLGLKQGESVSLVSSPNQEEATQKVTMSEIQVLMGSNNGETNNNQNGGNAPVVETRVSLGGDSIIDLVNGGVNLPEGVDQEFYVVKTNQASN